jgi:hypothetical protein
VINPETGRYHYEDNPEAKHAADAKDAARYRFLKEQAFLRDPYDHGCNYSSWNWTVELETGKSKGLAAPSDTLSFEETLDLLMMGTNEKS